MIVARTLRVCTRGTFRVKSFIPPLSDQISISWGSNISRTTNQLQQATHRPQTMNHRHSLSLISQARTLRCTSTKQAKPAANKNGKDDSIPFLQSKAHNFRVDDAYTVDTAKDRSRQKVALPLGVGIFGIIIYFGFLRDYGTKDRSIMGFLTRDIGDKLPDDVRERIYSEVDQSKLSVSGTNNK